MHWKSYAGAAHGIAVNTEGNDVFNFLTILETTHIPFTFTDQRWSWV
jgi:hypothetical protein